MIYLIATIDKEYVKIGYTRSNIRQRLFNLQAGCPIELIVLETFQGTLRDEKYLHLLCKDYNIRREWFKYSDELLNLVHSSLAITTKEDRIKTLQAAKTNEKDTLLAVEIPKNKNILNELYKEKEDKGYNSMWVYHEFIKKANIILRSNLQEIADKYGYKDGWVSYKMVDNVGKVFNDLKQAK